MRNLVTDTGGKNSFYCRPAIKIVPVNARTVVCTSDEPQGNATVEGYEEETFNW